MTSAKPVSNGHVTPELRRIVACHQPTYLPWAGLLHKVALADCFVVMDTVAFSRSGWQNRNRIKGAEDAFWLTVPLVRDSLRHGRLDAVEIASVHGARDWQDRHWNALRRCYARAPYWPDYAPRFEAIYQEKQWRLLADLNLALLETLLDAFGLRTELVMASDLDPAGRKSDLILDLCIQTEAAVYVSGALGHNYLVEQDFTDRGIRVLSQDYRISPYPQRFGDFVSHLSAVDILFNCGQDSRQVLLAGNLTRTAVRTALEQRRWPPTVNPIDPASAAERPSDES